jgi:hypothetical protein
LVVGALAVTFVASMFLNTVSNDFPYSYHTDELSKARQLMGSRLTLNYHHPLLLLEMTRVFLGQRALEMDPQAVVEVGRFASAVCGAVTTVALALAGYLVCGFVGLVISATMTGLCFSMILASHFMKEDAALCMGVALTLLAGVAIARGVGQRRWVLPWAALGAACGVATSGKYVGACTLAYALLAAALQAPRQCKLVMGRIAVLMASCLLVAVIINHSFFISLASMKMNEEAKGQIREAVAHGIGSHSEIMLRQPNSFIVTVLARESRPHVWLGLVLLLSFLVRGGETTRGAAVVTVLLAGLVWMVTLSLNRIPFQRYILPLVLQAHFLASLGFGVLLTRNNLSPRIRWAVALSLILAIGLWQGLPCLSLARQFGDDSRQRVRNWIHENIPAGSGLAFESCIGLETAGDTNRFPAAAVDFTREYHLRKMFFAADKRDIQTLKDKGVDYVAICGLAYERFFYPQVIAVETEKALLEQRRTFYRELSTSALQVYRDLSPYPTYGFTNPDIVIYKLSAAAHTSPDACGSRSLPFEVPE